jgi:hypothetical protein
VFIGCWAAAVPVRLLLQQQYLAGFSMNEAELAGMQSANEYGQNRTRFNFRRR